MTDKPSYSPTKNFLSTSPTNNALALSDSSVRSLKTRFNFLVEGENGLVQEKVNEFSIGSEYI